MPHSALDREMLVNYSTLFILIPFLLLSIFFSFFFALDFCSLLFEDDTIRSGSTESYVSCFLIFVENDVQCVHVCVCDKEGERALSKA